MLIPIKRDISQAKAKAEYLSSQDIDTLMQFVKQDRKRLEIVEIIGNNTEQIIKDTIAAMITTNSHLPLDADDSRLSEFWRYTEIILRYITYSLFSENASIFDKQFFKELRGHYLELEIPLKSVIQAISRMKFFTVANINNFQAKKTIGNNSSDYSSLFSELESYFDLVILSLENDFNQQPENQDNELNIWQRGNQIIVFSSGCSFLGGLIAQLPGALIGAIVGAIYGSKLFSIQKLEIDSHIESVVNE